jgi:hypothetical protein
MPTARVSRSSSPSSFPHRLKREFLVRCYFSFTLFSEIEDECKDLMIFGLQTFLSSSSPSFNIFFPSFRISSSERKGKRSIMGFRITGARRNMSTTRANPCCLLSCKSRRIEQGADVCEESANPCMLLLPSASSSSSRVFCM